MNFGFAGRALRHPNRGHGQALAIWAAQIAANFIDHTVFGLLDFCRVQN